jgi:Ribonuclease G/E
VTGDGRRLYLDRSPGEARGVVTLDGKIERLIIDREQEPPRARLGETWRGRVRSVTPGFRGAFIDLGQDRDGWLALSAGARLAQGAIVDVEVTAEARDDKGPALRLLGGSEGKPGRLTAAPPIEVRLQTFAPQAEIETGPDARALADDAEEMALANSVRVASDLIVTVERTRGLTAVDVDFGGAEANRKTVLEANRSALFAAARLARLKGLGGLIVIDLAGPAKERDHLTAAAREAFAPDEPGVVIAGISRLGVLELAKPWGERPARDTLCDPDGRLSVRTIAQRLLRALEQEGRSNPGSARIQSQCGSEAAAAAAPFLTVLGPRFSIEPQGEMDRFTFRTRAL